MTPATSRCKTKLYIVWVGMRQRCTNPNNKSFKWYGAKGISVCEEWNNFDCFKKWADENGYQEGLTIDRLNNNLDYSPSNCQWITRSINSKRCLVDNNYHIQNKKGKDNPRARAIYCIELDQIFDTATEAAKAVRGLQGNISSAASGRIPSAYKYHWRWCNEM